MQTLLIMALILVTSIAIAASLVAWEYRKTCHRFNELAEQWRINARTWEAVAEARSARNVRMLLARANGEDPMKIVADTGQDCGE